LIGIHNLSKTIDSKIILKDISFRAEKGRILSILGPSGSGKTTLLRILAFLEKDFSGQYFFDGENALENREKFRYRITMVFQNPVLFNMSVFENIAFGLRARGMKREAIRAIVGETLEMVRMVGFEKKNSLLLSGGEAQMIALARAFAIKPDVLLLDEPTANLDPTNVSLIEDIVRDMNKSGTTIIMATHNIPQAERLSDKILFLLYGRAEEVLSRESFFRSKKEVTRAFIEGRMVY